MGANRLPENEITKVITSAFLAAFGGLARLLSSNGKNRLRVSKALSGCLVAAFTGILAYLASVYFGLPDSIAYVIAGVSGWLGPQAIDMLIKIISRKTGIELQDEKTDTGKSLDKKIKTYANNNGGDR